LRTVDIHAAKTQLSRLVEEASKGDAFVIAKAGRPMVKVVPLFAPPDRPRPRLGILEGAFTVPDDFDRMGEDEIGRLFGSGR
jgi:prevent-host-death family protein